MRIGSSTSINIAALFVREQTKREEISQDDDDAFSIVIVTEARGWNSSLGLMWKHKIMKKIFGRLCFPKLCLSITSA